MLNNGFFSRQTVQEQTKRTTAKRGQHPGCVACGLKKKCNTPEFPIAGKGRKGILIINEHPTKKEDDMGRPFVGDHWLLIKQQLEKRGIDLNRDCWKIDALACRPPKEILSRFRKKKESLEFALESCRARVLRAIDELQPKIIIALGNISLSSVLLHKWKADEDGLGSIERWRGYCIPDYDYNAWLCPIWHPSRVISADCGAADKIFMWDLKHALSHLDKELPENIIKKFKVRKIYDEEKLDKLFQKLADKVMSEYFQITAIDYEGTGLKPDWDKQQLVSCAITINQYTAVAFPMTETVLNMRSFRRLLKNPYLRKIGANIGFENRWTMAKMGFEIEGWIWDTMHAAHVQDNRIGVNSVKFLAYRRLGILDYNSDVVPYIKAADKTHGANSLNRMEELPIQRVLEYNGMDVLVEHNIALQQMEELGFDIDKLIYQPDYNQGRPVDKNNINLRDAYGLMHHGAITMSRFEQRGMNIDVEYFEKQKKHLKRRLERLSEKLRNTRLGKLWYRTFGDTMKYSKDEQLRTILYDKLGFEAEVKTDSGLDSVDKSALERLKMPEIYDLLEYRKLEKARNTFIKGILREAVDGIVHPFYHLGRVKTYRSSSSNPNWQNIPTRDPDIGRIIRKGVVAPKGMFILEVDYSGAEVRVAACNNKDPQLIKYINDPSTDMHRDTACDCYMITIDQIVKLIRTIAKNKMVFPEFYGSIYIQIAKDLWDAIILYDLELKDGTPLYDHLASKGIHCYEDFEEHIKEVENKFWNKRFKVYNKWRKDMVTAFNKHPVIKAVTGFEYKGLMKRTEIINYGTQGPAFHCLLISAIIVDDWAITTEKKSKPNAQIHDSLLSLVVPEELNEYMDKVEDVMTREVAEIWPWIIVPLEIEADLTPLGGSWYDKKPISKRNKPCKCGNKWLWKKKDDEKKEILWTCPCCDKRYVEEM